MTAAPPVLPSVLRALPEAAVSMAAALLTLACAQWLAPGPGSAVLAVVLSLSLARSRLDRDRRGRLEVAFKSLLRLAGAAGGCVAAALLAAPADAHGGAAMILLALFLGTWLRQINYAWWALFATVALALLQNYAGLPAAAAMMLRLAAIAAGAAIGVAAAWLVLPVRSTDVLRRRLAGALAALGEALDPAIERRDATAFVRALDDVESLAPAFRAARVLGLRQPADWIDALSACRAPALALIGQGATPGNVRRAVGAARQALREPERLLDALKALRDALPLPAGERVGVRGQAGEGL